MPKFTPLFMLLIMSLAINSKAIAQVPIETTEPANSPIRPNPTQPRRVILPNPNPSTGTISAGQRFSCQSQNGQYTVMYQPKSQSGQFYAWAVPALMGGGWSPERRCNEISRRLEQYRPDGLVELRSGIENGYNVICATTDQNGACRIVLTVPVGADPNSIRDRVFSNLTTADSGQTTVGVNTYVQGDRSSSLGRFGGLFSANPQTNFRNDGIDLKPFLDRNDGGTGANLKTTKNLKFNPNRF